MTRLLVIGASQGIGLAVCKAAAGRGHSVRAMSRRGSSPNTDGKAIEPFQGDALNSKDVLRALEDIDVVVQALGIPPSLDLMLRPVTLFSAATQCFAFGHEDCGRSQACECDGVRRRRQQRCDQHFPTASIQGTAAERLQRQDDPRGADCCKRYGLADRTTGRSHKLSGYRKLSSANAAKQLAQRDHLEGGRRRLHRDLEPDGLPSGQADGEGH